MRDTVAGFDSISKKIALQSWYTVSLLQGGEDT